MQYAAAAFASGSLAEQWRTVIAAGPVETQQTPGLTLSAEVTTDRVYIASHRLLSAEPITIVALNRADGQERARWNVDLAGREGAIVSLRATPDGASLALLAPLNTETGMNVVPKSLFVRLHLPDGQEMQRLPITQTDNAAFFSLDSPMTPDGRTLYHLSYGDSPTHLVLRFFDLQTGATLPAIDLPFAGKEDFLAYEQTISHDGHHLYVLAPTLHSLVVVNLMTRRIEDQVHVDTAAITTTGNASLFARVFGIVHGFFVQDVAAKGALLGGMQLSPDGRTLYAVGATGRSYDTQAHGIWVIDMGGWRVTKQWLPDVSPSALLLSGDGGYLTMQQSQGGIRTLETASGNEVFATDSGNDGSGSLFSLVERYRERYGKSPNISTTARDLHTSPPFAALTASVNTKTIIAGDTVTIEAQFTDPASDTPINPEMKTVRYEPPAAVTALFCRYGKIACGPSVPLTNTGYGHYRGSLSLTDAGNWSLQVLADWGRDEVPNRQALVENAVTVQATFTGSDGNRYIMRVTTDPGQLTAKQVATIRVAFVDATRGTPLPQGVMLFGGLPPTLDADFFVAGVMYRLETLPASGHGIYTGAVTLGMPGSWRVEVQVPAGDGATATIPVGTMQVTGER
ncbi:MAG: YncE family protein [Thermomicrobiales bacterium]